MSSNGVPTCPLKKSIRGPRASGGPTLDGQVQLPSHLGEIHVLLKVYVETFFVLNLFRFGWKQVLRSLRRCSIVFRTGG